MSEFESIQRNYFIACNTLHRYRERIGFNPGVRVRCKFRDDPEKFGIIAPYAERWGSCGRDCVPVNLDNGHRQHWEMGDLTIIEA